ncbi:MAG TPA: tRNA (adenosine(37)-N6)-dimethylallyltransferase MiaA [Dehalococcoidia bacterium]|nr:tRNA (adenosine(37)-N6)-dimethylallyltransferase MiaA [Dehalococcoidia bacterium]
MTARPSSEGPLVVILGPTASGKTRHALQLGRRLPVEVISADSRQVYRHMDIGTAKPTASELAALPHHLIDVVNPDEAFHLGDYLRLAHAAIGSIRARGHIPMLVGGSGQYIWATVEGWEVPAVAPDLELRALLTERALRDGPLVLHEQLQRLDPVAAGAIHPHNVRRVVRALELQARTSSLASAQRSRQTPRTDAVILGLHADRRELYTRIDARVDQMFERGLIQEVQHLLDLGYEPSLPSMSGIGYTQVIRCLSGQVDRAEAVARMKTATHRLARQQAAWFRSADTRIHWLEPDDIGAAVKLVQAWKPLRTSAARGDVA